MVPGSNRTECFENISVWRMWCA